MGCNIHNTQPLPCALLNSYQCQNNEQRPLAHEDEARVLAFQHWVAYERTQFLTVSIKEKLTCPLLWCRQEFLDITLFLQHVSTCVHLPSGLYWCSKCARPERFNSDTSTVSMAPVGQIRRKSSKLKRAMSLFKDLRAKTCRRGHKPTSTSLQIQDPYEYMREASKAKELDSSPTGQVEMADTSQFTKGIADCNSKQLCQKKTPQELSASASTYHFCRLTKEKIAVSKSEHDLQDRGSGHHAAELHGSSLPVRSIVDEKKVDEATRNTASAPLDQVLEQSDVWAQDRDCFGKSIRQPSMPLETNMAVDDFRLASALETQLQPNRSYSTHPKALLSTQMQVQEISDLVEMLNSEWIQRANVIRGWGTPYWTQDASWLCKHGVKTLKKCFRGSYPDTFQDVFALMHIAFAMVFSNRGNINYDWSDFFEDMVHWKKALSSQSDIELFMWFVNLWLPDPKGPTSIACGTITSSSPDDAFKQYHGTDRSVHTSAVSEQSVCTQLGTDGISTFSTELEERQALKDCSRFFPAFEYAYIMERAAASPSQLEYHAQQYVSSQNELKREIIDPLYIEGRFQVLNDVFIETIKQLRKGYLRSVREVEVALTINAERACSPQWLMEEFLAALTDLCNKYMRQAGSNWRNRSLVAHSDSFLAIHQQLQGKERFYTDFTTPPERITWPSVQNDLELHDSESCQSPISPSPSHIVTPPSSMETDYTNTPDSLHSSPPGDSNSSMGHVSCENCGENFTGKHRKGHLLRHRKYTKKCAQAGKASGVSCPECGKRFSRSDNLRQHLRRLHGVPLA